MAVVNGRNKILGDITNALGLKNVIKLDLHMAHKDIVTVTVEYYPEVDNIIQLIPIFKKFKLIEIINENPINNLCS